MLLSMVEISATLMPLPSRLHVRISVAHLVVSTIEGIIPNLGPQDIEESKLAFVEAPININFLFIQTEENKFINQ